MSNNSFYHEFLNEEGKIERVTFEALEIWTSRGQEIIPPGFSFINPIALKNDNDIKSFILYQYHRTVKLDTEITSIKDLYIDLINNTETMKNAKKRRFRRFWRIDRLILVLINLFFYKQDVY